MLRLSERQILEKEVSQKILDKFERSFKPQVEVEIYPIGVMDEAILGIKLVVEANQYRDVEDCIYLDKQVVTPVVKQLDKFTIVQRIDVESPVLEGKFLIFLFEWLVHLNEF